MHRFLAAFRRAMPVIFFFITSYFLILLLFGLQYTIAASAITVFFSSRYRRGAGSVLGYLILILHETLIITLATIGSWNIYLGTALNILVPFILVFTQSTQFNPRGYFAYALLYVFLSLMPPVTGTDFVIELVSLWMLTLYMALVIWIWNRVHHNSPGAGMSIPEILSKLSNLVLLLIQTDRKEELEEEFGKLMRAHVVRRQSFSAMSTRDTELENMVSTLLQRFSYMIADYDWHSELDTASAMELRRLSSFLSETAKYIGTPSQRDQMEHAQELLDSMTIPEGRIRIFSRSIIHMVDFMLQSEAIIKKGSETDAQLTQLGIQIQFMDMIKEYMADADNEFSLLPADIGLEDKGLSTMISDYNEVVIERRRLMLGASETNPRIQALTTQIVDMRKAVLLSINQLRDSYQYRYDIILNEALADKAKMAEIPSQQFDIAKIERQQMIVEPLYVLLRQKKEEALISLYAQTDNARIVEPADGPDKPSSPKSMMVYAFCMILGLVAPPGVFFIGNMLKRKVSNVKDVQDRISLPIIGYIPESEKALVVQGSRDVLTETFRAVRANLGFLSGKVFQITSSISGEGKSTVAVNVALTLAFAGKKVLFIETDLRNGFDYRIFNVQKSSKGLATYLSGNYTLEEVLRPGLINPNLDVIFRGTMPPNPNELLSSSKMENLIAEMREKYDYVICDSAPYIIISDPIVVNNYVDTTLYVVRCGVSDLRFLDEISFACESGRLKNVSLIVNGINPKSKIYGKYGGYGYGYGYGYGGGTQ